MLCEICKKNEATIHIQEIVGGQKKSMHLCSICAAAKQAGSGLDFGPFNLAGLLYKLSAEAENNTKESSSRSAEHDLVCPECSWSETQLNASGRLGCEHCYRVFAPLLSEALKNMHRGSSHVGKHPQGKGQELCSWHRELARLQKLLQNAIAEEDYESAAVLRDQINELKLRCDAIAGKGKNHD